MTEPTHSNSRTGRFEFRYGKPTPPAPINRKQARKAKKAARQRRKH